MNLKIKLNKHTTLIFLCPLLLLTILSCEKEPTIKEKLFKENLDKIDKIANDISPSFCILYANLLTMTHPICDPELNKIVSDILGNKYFERYCSVLKKANEYTLDKYRELLEKKQLNREGYFFYAWKGTSDNNDEKMDRFGAWTSNKGDEPVGLFKDLKDCNWAEETFRELDISTRHCRSWVSEKITIFDGLEQK